MGNKQSNVNAKKRKLSRILGFSLMEVIVVVAILAVFAVMVTPAFVSYVELSRSQKDISALGEVDNAVVVSLTNIDALDEMYEQSKYNNFSCYIDCQSEDGLTKIITSRPTASYQQYTFGDETRQANQTIYYLAGHMYGLTITFEPDGDKNDRHYDISEGIVNKYISNGTPIKLSDCDALYRSIRQTVGDTVGLTSQTYKNSEYTIFIRMSPDSSSDPFAQDAVEVYGQYGGTSLGKGPHNHQPADEREIDHNVGGNNDCAHNVVKVAGTPATCGSTGLTDGSYCSICGDVFKKQGVIPATGNHTWRTSADGTKRTCDVCGKTEDIGSAHVHSYTAKVISSSTCKTHGTTEYRCACGHVYTEQNVPLDLNNHEGTLTHPLAEDGKCMAYTCHHDIYTTEHTWNAAGNECTLCHYKKGHTHIFTARVEDDAEYLKNTANCQEPLTYYKSCSICGMSSKGQIGESTFTVGEKDPTKHVGEQTYPLAEENKCMAYTCCRDVYTTEHQWDGDQCELCLYMRDHVHVFTAEVEDNNKYLKNIANCQAPLTYYMSCEGCGLSSEGQVGESTFTVGEKDPTKHVGERTYPLAEKNKCMAYTCHHDVYTTEHVWNEAGDECTLCHYKEGHVHIYSVKLATDDYLASEATCTSKATYYYSCSCGVADDGNTFESGEVNPNNHTGDSENGGTVNVHTRWSCCKATISSDHSYDTDDVWSSSCSSVTVYKNCDCGYGYTVGSSYSVYEREYQEGTCAASGYSDHYAYVNGTKYYCPYGHPSGKNLNNHVGPYNESSQDATCIATGYYKKTCSACTNVVEETTYEKDLSNHVGGTETAVTTEATCNSEGLKTTTCNSCGEVTGTEPIEKNPNNHVGTTTTKTTTNATCTQKGVKTTTCDSCDGIIGTEEIPAPGHDYYYENVSTETCMRKCTRCDYQGAGGHSWTGTGCIKTCSNNGCGGKKTTHNYSYAYMDQYSCRGTCTRCSSIIISSHNYIGSSCTKTCDQCLTPKTEHTRGAAATCTTAQTCTVCDTVLVEALGHDWKATGAPGLAYCTRCGKNTNPLSLDPRKEENTM